MSKRGKDKRTESNLKKFYKKMHKFEIEEKLAFVYFNKELTDLIISSKGVLYRINYGERSIDIVRPYMEKDGHLRYGTTIHGKKFKKYIHQMVAEYFIPNPENKKEIHHIDGDELNNDASNLQWVTHQEHVQLTRELDQYVGKSGSENSASLYTDSQIELACKLIEENNLYPNEICEITGISQSVFNHLLHRDTYWKTTKEKYDLSRYNKFRRNVYSDEQKQEFIKIRKDKPHLTLKEISKILKIRYDAIKKWNTTYKELIYE